MTQAPYSFYTSPVLFQPLAKAENRGNNTLRKSVFKMDVHFLNSLLVVCHTVGTATFQLE